MELRRYLSLLQQRLWLIIITVIAGVFGGWLITAHQPVYQSSSTIYVGTKSLPFTNGGALSQEATGLAEISQTFAVMIPSRTIAQAALAATHVDRTDRTVVSETKTLVAPGTNLIKVTVSDTDAHNATLLAEGMSEAFVQEIKNFETPIPGVPASGQPAYVFEHAILPTHPLSSGLGRNMTIGGVFGLVISVTIVFLLDYLDITVKSPEELERRVGLPVLGIIPVQRRLLGGLSPSTVIGPPTIRARTDA